MNQYAAFLRAINVSGRVVKMESLRRLFESMGFSRVSTFIASGNVLFETGSGNAGMLERKIESALRQELGYEVAAFLRTADQVRTVANYHPFPSSRSAAALQLNVAFLSGPPDGSSRRRVMTLRTDVDDFRFHDREFYWLSRLRQSESTFSNARLEKTLGRPSTMRGMATIQKLAALL